MRTIGGKKNGCQHVDLYFADGAFVIKCLQCKGEWFAVPDSSEAYAYEEARKKEWIENPKRTL